MKIINKLLSILLILCLLSSNFTTIFAKSVSESDTVHLIHDHSCISLLRFKGEDLLKLIAYICYQDPDTGIKYPAFCVEPEKPGIATGAGDSYDVYLSSIDNPILWRILYKGYCGSTYQDWGLECDDDLYYATKVAVHCFTDGTTPTSKYEIPHRVGWGQNVTLEEVQRRGAKVLEVAQSIYDYAYTHNDNYIEATINISKGTQTETNLSGTKYLIQNYSVVTNKELTSYKVSILGFPSGTKILNSSNYETSNMSNSNFKIAIPVSQISNNFSGTINITKAKIKSFPIFYADSGNNETQNYIISDPTEIKTSNTTLDIEAYKSTLKIIKKDSENNQPITGAIFSVKYSDSTNIGNFTTDDKGTITINNLKQDNVLVNEISTPNNYVLDSSTQNVTLQYNSTSTLEVFNARKKGNIKIIKYDKDDNSIVLEGVYFKLYNEQNQEIGTYTTNSNGEIFIDNIDIGKYTIKEIKAISGYELGNNVSFVVDYNQTTTLEIDNEKSKGMLEILKVDADNNDVPIEGAAFNVLDKNKNIIETITTNSNGIATTSRLPSYNEIYYLQETIANEKYVLDTDLHEFTLENDNITKLVLTNELKKGKIQIEKVDNDDSSIKLEGVVFNIINNTTNEIVDTIITDKNGIATTKALNIFDTYTALEIETDKRYELNLTSISNIKIPYNDILKINVTNERKKGNICIKKIDADNPDTLLSNIKFELFDKNMNLVAELITNEKGEATSTLLPTVDEIYYLKEVSTNILYELSAETKVIELKDNETLDIVFENYCKTGSLEIHKVDKDNNLIPIEDTTFEIIDETTNEIVDTVTTNADGIAKLDNLKVTRTYTLHEISTNKKYNINSEKITSITILPDKTTLLKIENEKKKGHLKVIKIDADNLEIKLQGVKFELLDSSMNLIEELITNEHGEAISSLLPTIDETYFIKEIETLDNYVLNNELTTIVLEEDKITELVLKNEKIKGYLEITKVDAKNDTIKLKDAVFQIYNENDELVDTITTDENGKGLSTPLEKGKYYFKEIDSGSPYYLLNQNIFNFEIVNNNEIIPITVKNEPIIISANINKQGDIETKPNEIVHYTFSNVENKSNTYLDTFKWYDYIPTDFARVQKITTGTWNQELLYKVYYKTNKSDDYILYMDNLTTKENHEIDFLNISFLEDEYITEIYFDFGRVDIGFKEDISPSLKCRTLETVKDGSCFTNSTRIIGNYCGLETEASSKWTTIVRVPKKPEPVLPRTGW